MNKLPNITDPRALESIVIKQMSAMRYDDRLRELILANITKMEGTARANLEKLLYGMSMQYNG